MKSHAQPRLVLEQDSLIFIHDHLYQAHELNL
jgi:hypothetical protein